MKFTNRSAWIKHQKIYFLICINGKPCQWILGSLETGVAGASTGDQRPERIEAHTSSWFRFPEAIVISA